MICFKVNQEKTLEAVVYVASKVPGIDIYHTVKTMFYADKKHLNMYARPVLGDLYIKMDNGPVPSLVRDIINNNNTKTATVFTIIKICSTIIFLSCAEGNKFFEMPYNWLIPRLTTNNDIQRTTIEDSVIWLEFKDPTTTLANSGVKYFCNTSSITDKSTFNTEAKKAISEQIGIIDIIK